MLRKKAFWVAIPALLFAGAGAFLLAQVPSAPTPNANAVEPGDTKINVSVTNIIAPVLVTDRSGNIIDGLQGHDFHLFDNNKEQNINFDVAFLPISLVVCIEASVRVDGKILSDIKHLGTLLPVIAGDHGEIAVMAFDSRLRVMQDFTPDSDKVKAAIDKINAGNSSSRMIDAVDEAVRMLKKRPADNRKIVLLVSETRDVASEGRLKETLIDANFANVAVYTVDITQMLVRLTEKPQPGRPNAIDVTAYPSVGGNPATPTQIETNYAPQNQAQFLPVLTEIYKDTKRIFVDSPSKAISKATGGEDYSFTKEKALEDAVQRISTEIRSQYLLSYNPNNKGEPGFHTITVQVEHPGYIAKTRPGYWVGGGKQ